VSAGPVIRPYAEADYAATLKVCVAAFAPIHAGFAQALGLHAFALQYADWRERYAATLSDIPKADANTKVFVAEMDGVLVGFVFAILDAQRKTGEIGLNAVAPAFQRRGIGRALYAYALDDLKQRGAEIAYVGTGGDDAHAPARAAYRALGFDRAIPSLHLFKVL
jgi:ribosomal protein S18 acetylase RimI-like enzyme